jgi:hypothetical protein
MTAPPPRFIFCLVITGWMVASMDSCKFSIRNGFPVSMALNRSSFYFLSVNLQTLSPASFYWSFSQVTPCNCGSMIRLHRSELARMHPFWVETKSDGNLWPFHSATVAGSASSKSGLASSACAITPNLFVSMNFTKSLTIISLYTFVNGPI